jgi:O-methyltransferase domain
MLSILHDWSDDDALRILDRVREAMATGAKVVIGDAVLRGPNEWDLFKGG